MTETILFEIIKYLVPTIIGFLFGFIVSQFRKFNGLLIIVKWTAKRMIIEDCQAYLEKGYMTPQESADIDKLWDVYHRKLKLNSEGQTYYDLAKKLEVRVDKNETK